MRATYVALIGLWLRGGCGLLTSQDDLAPSDGEVCSEDADCSTEICTTSSLCSHTLCRCSAQGCPEEGEAVSDCREGWVCVDASRISDPIVEFFGGMPREDEGYCRPKCNAGCPEHYLCLDGTFCSPDTEWADPTAILSWSGPAMGSHVGWDPPGNATVERGATVSLRGEGQSPTGSEIVELRWEIIESSGARATHEGAELDIVIPDGASFVRAELIVQDSEGRSAQTHAVFEACAGPGASCGFGGSGCCNECGDSGDRCL